MKKFIVIYIILVAFFFGTGPAAQAANHYIRAGATGTGTGANWTNAWPTFSAVAWTRGDTYYVAGGTYNEDVRISSALSGASWIVVKKANVTDNSGDAGWNSSYATTMATINGSLQLSDGYVEVDGVTGSGMNAYGIQVNQHSSAAQEVVGCDNNTGPFHLFHIEAHGLGYSSSANWTSGFYQNNSSIYQKGTHIAYCWFHDVTGNGFTLGGFVGTSYSDYGFLLENCVISETGGCTAVDQHSQGMQLSYGNEDGYTIIRNNVFRNIRGSAMIAFLGSSNHHDARIYNNIFYTTDTSVYNFSPGVIYADPDGGACTNIVICNNTFYNVNLAELRFMDTSALKNIVLENNVWEKSYFSVIHMGISTESDNGYFGNTGDTWPYGVPSGTPNQVNGSATTFVNGGAADFHLLAGGYAVGKGLNLSTYFTTDFSGNPRPASGTWDIGAYEYVPSVIYGDVSGDGNVSAYDAALAAQYAVGLITLTPEQVTRADVSGGGGVSAYDAALIAQRAVGLISKFPVE